MSKLGLFLAVVALGLSAYVVYEHSERASRMDGIERGMQELQGSLTGVEARLDAILEAGHLPQAELLAGGRTAPLDGAGADGAGVGLATRKPATQAERLAALEKTVADQEETIEDLEKAKGEKGNPLGMVRSAMNDRFYWNLDAAAKSMELSDRQKSDMKDIQDRAMRELDDVFAIPNDEGVTWEDASKMKFDAASGDGGSMVSLMSNFQKAQKFKKSLIPGTNETYGDAEKRVRKNALGEMRNLLTDKQVKKWDKAHKDGLVRSKRGGMSIAFGQTVIETEGK